MKEEAATDAQLRQFLLGKVDDEERQRIERLFLTDSSVKEKVVAAEQELFDDYLEESLSPADREAFLSLYGDTAAQRRKLRIAKSVQQWALDHSKKTQFDSKTPNSIWSRLLGQLRQKPVVVIPVAVAATIVIVVALVWINIRRTDRDTEYLAFNQELAQLNTPENLRESASGPPDLTLKPVSVRSVEADSALKSRPDSAVAEIRLLWMQKEDYPTYMAVLRRPSDDRLYSISNLPIQNENGKFIRLRIPVHMLTRGSHQIELSGISVDGSQSSAEVYSFTVAE